MRVPIGVMHVGYNVGRIEQHDQMLREIRHSVEIEISIAKEDRTGLRNRERSSDNGKVDIRQIPGSGHASDIFVACNLRHERTHDLGIADLRLGRRQNITDNRRVEEHSAHPVQVGLEGVHQQSRCVIVEQGYVRERPVQAWQIGSDRGQDIVAAAHGFAPRFA